MFKGTPASSGIEIAKVYLYQPKELVVSEKRIERNQVPKEIDRFNNALAKSRDQISEIQTRAASEIGQEKAAIFGAHLLVLKDSLLIEEIIHSIESQLINSESAVQSVIDRYVRLFDSLQDSYMSERAVDIKDVGKRLQRNLMGVEKTPLVNLKERVILIARDLTPSDTAQMDRKKIIGFVTEVGGPTSHTAIMARALEIPAVVGVGPILSKLQADSLMIIDGHKGLVIVNPDEETLEHYQKLKLADQAVLEELNLLKDLPAKTIDGFQVHLEANVGSPREIKRAVIFGAGGIGLYRTEYLYMDRAQLPSEEEQVEAYLAATELMGEKAIIIRTLDIGGDKDLPYLELPIENNPFLGWRGIRLCLDKKDIFKTQLRAILRASVNGTIKIMFPMISGIQEVRDAKGILEEAKKELQDEDIAFDEAIKVGIMIEIPSAAIIADLLAKEVDFFSIGTNDLIQYNLSLDRTNEKIAHLYEPFHPAVLRLIRNVIEAGDREGIEVAMCGEMAGDLLAVPVLLGLGLTHFSMSPISLLQVKKVIRSLTLAEAREIADKVMSFDAPQNIRSYLEKEQIIN